MVAAEELLHLADFYQHPVAAVAVLKVETAAVAVEATRETVAQGATAAAVAVETEIMFPPIIIKEVQAEPMAAVAVVVIPAVPINQAEGEAEAPTVAEEGLAIIQAAHPVAMGLIHRV